jgi:hypothetical protein
MSSLGLTTKTALASALHISIQALRNREQRGLNCLDDVELLCSREGLNLEWVLYGTGYMGQESITDGKMWYYSKGATRALEEDLQEIIRLLQEMPDLKINILQILRGKRA